MPPADPNSDPSPASRRELPFAKGASVSCRAAHKPPFRKGRWHGVSRDGGIEFKSIGDTVLCLRRTQIPIPHPPRGGSSLSQREPLSVAAPLISLPFEKGGGTASAVTEGSSQNPSEIQYCASGGPGFRSLSLLRRQPSARLAAMPFPGLLARRPANGAAAEIAGRLPLPPAAAAPQFPFAKGALVPQHSIAHCNRVFGHCEARRAVAIRPLLAATRQSVLSPQGRGFPRQNKERTPPALAYAAVREFTIAVFVTSS